MNLMTVYHIYSFDRVFWRRDRESNPGMSITPWRISNPLHYRSATPPFYLRLNLFSLFSIFHSRCGLTYHNYVFINGNLSNVQQTRDLLCFLIWKNPMEYGHLIFDFQLKGQRRCNTNRWLCRNEYSWPDTAQIFLQIYSHETCHVPFYSRALS